MAEKEGTVLRSGKVIIRETESDSESIHSNASIQSQIELNMENNNNQIENNPIDNNNQPIMEQPGTSSDNIPSRIGSPLPEFQNPDMVNILSILMNKMDQQSQNFNDKFDKQSQENREMRIELKNDTKELKDELNATLNSKFEIITKKFTEHENKFTKIENNLTNLNKELTTKFNNNTDKIEHNIEEINLIKTDVDEITNNIQIIKETVEGNKTQINHVTQEQVVIRQEMEKITHNLQTQRRDYFNTIDKKLIEFEQKGKSHFQNNNSNSNILNSLNHILYRKEEIPKFYGTEANPLFSLNLIKKYINLQGTDYNVKGPWSNIANILSLCLKGSASVWFDQISSQLENWMDFEREFKNLYWDESIQHQIKHKLEFNYYKPQGKLKMIEYFQEMYNLMSQAYPSYSESEKVKLLARHFGEKVSDAVFYRKTCTYTEMLTVLRQHDENNRQIRNNPPKTKEIMKPNIQTQQTRFPSPIKYHAMNQNNNNNQNFHPPPNQHNYQYNGQRNYNRPYNTRYTNNNNNNNGQYYNQKPQFRHQNSNYPNQNSNFQTPYEIKPNFNPNNTVRQNTNSPNANICLVETTHTAENENTNKENQALN